MSGGGNNEEADLAATAWPGFVDILSSVLIMFVFFLMITAVALNFHTILFKSKLVANNEKVIEEQVKQQVSQSGGELKTENEQLKQELAQAQAKVVEDQEAHVEAQRELETKLKMLQQSAQMAESEEQSLKAMPAEGTIYIFYGADAISLTEASVGTIEQFIKDNGKPGMTLKVEASFNTTNKVDQTARRVAVARMLNARNIPLRLGMSAANIKATLVDGQEVDGQLDWVRIVLEK